MFQKEKDKKIIFRKAGSAFLIIFLFFFSGNTFFNHAHHIDENIIIHSHPFKSDSHGNPNHNHSRSDYLLIDLINNLLFFTTINIVLIAGLVILLNPVPTYYLNPFLSLVTISPFTIRGPPAYKSF